MEYIYGALLLHSTGKKVDERSLKKVMSAAGIEVNEAKIKAVISSLENVNIDEAIKTSVAVAPVAQAQASGPKPEEKKEKKKEDDVKSEEEAASGLAALFG